MYRFTLFFFLTILFGTFQSCADYGDAESLQASKVTKITNEKIKLENGKEYDIFEGTNDEYTTLILIRHAEKEAEGENPRLNSLGTARAERLKDILLPLKPERIYTTSFNRTVLTSMPLAKAIKKPNMHYKPKKYHDLFDIVFEEHKVQKAVIIGHSNTIPKMLNLLVGEDRYEDLDEKEYSKMYLVQTKGLGESEVTELMY